MLKSYVTYFIVLLITLLLVSCDSDNNSIIPLPVNDTKPVWPQVGYNGRHTGNRYGINVNIPPVQSGNVYWMDTITTSYISDGSEAACDASGNIYFRYSTGNYGHIIKYKPDGARIWVRDSLLNDAYNGIALSVDETRIYYSENYKFVCRDSSGRLIWTIPEGCYQGGIPCIGKDGTIFTPLTNYFVAISPGGNIMWRLDETNIGNCWPVLDRFDNVYFCGRSSNPPYEVIKINKNGNIIFKYPLSDWIRSVVIDGYNNIYFRDEEKLISLNEKGDFRWVKEIPGQGFCHVVPAITKENRIIIDSGYNVICLDISGKTEWTAVYPNSGYIEPYITLDDEDNIYFNHWHEGTLMAVSSIDKNGNLRWQSIDPTIGWVLPGLTLSPLGMLFDTPKRPYVVFTIR